MKNLLGSNNTIFKTTNHNTTKNTSKSPRRFPTNQSDYLSSFNVSPGVRPKLDSIRLDKTSKNLLSGKRSLSKDSFSFQIHGGTHGEEGQPQGMFKSSILQTQSVFQEKSPKSYLPRNNLNMGKLGVGSYSGKGVNALGLRLNRNSCVSPDMEGRKRFDRASAFSTVTSEVPDQFDGGRFLGRAGSGEDAGNRKPKLSYQLSNNSTFGGNSRQFRVSSNSEWSSSLIRARINHFNLPFWDFW